MKTKVHFILTAFLLFSWPVFLSGEGISVPTRVGHVTVFLKGAEITRNGSVDLTPGMHELVFRGLASDIRENSVRVEGKGDLTILSVRARANYLVDNKANPEWVALNKKRQALIRQKEALSVQKKVLESEEVILGNNQSVAGQNGLNITTLDNALTYFTKKMTAIKTKQLETDRKMKELDEKIGKILQQLDQLVSRQKKASGEVVVAVNVNKPGKASFKISYYTAGASWRPGYDVRVADVNKDVEISLKAYVKQTTGEAWNKIPLTLSTGNPSLGGNKPELSPWYLDFSAPVRYYMAPKTRTKTAQVEAMAAPVQQLDEVVRTSQGMITTQYDITLPFTIYPENREQALTIRKISLPAEYAYYVVPKKSRDAFLVASVTGWKKYDLLPGRMNLFLEGMFVGTSYLDASLPVDTLQLTLGRDRGIKVERKKIEDLTRKKTIGGSIIENHGWQITVMNTKKAPVHLIIEDQIPVSKQKDIVVEPVELSGARLDKVTGKCTWDVELPPDGSRSFLLKYTVKYPKNKTVYGE